MDTDPSGHALPRLIAGCGASFAISPSTSTRGPVFRAINKAGRVWGDGMSPKVLRDVVRAAAARAGIDKLAPHDLRRTCARLCHLAGGVLDQIQFLLGHVSIQTTERYLGCKQKLRIAVNDRLGIEPNAA
jgi:integrase